LITSPSATVTAPTPAAAASPPGPSRVSPAPSAPALPAISCILPRSAPPAASSACRPRDAGCAASRMRSSALCPGAPMSTSSALTLPPSVSARRMERLRSAMAPLSSVRLARQRVVDRPNHAGLRCRQQLGERREVVAERPAAGERGGEVETADAAYRRQPQLPGALRGDVLGLPALEADRRRLDVGAALAVGAGLALSARRACGYAAVAVFGAAAEVPFGAGADAFFSSSSTSAGRK
jgi:hypothetical protein